MLRQFELVERLKAYDPTADEDLLNRAYVFTLKAHGSQLRASGAPYFSHPVEVAGILTDLKLDIQSIVTGLLHDTVEDTVATLEEIQDYFGPEIAHLVDGVTKLSRLELQSEATRQAENFRKLVVAMSSDIRVLLVKLADRLHNMRTLHFIQDPAKRKRIARETMDIYAPLAERMGMHKIKDELEDLAFAELNPEMHESITTRLKFLYDSSESSIQTILDDLKRNMEESNLQCQVSGRLKTPYSIWGKMQRKNIMFEQLSDIMAFRVVVSSVPDCYQALGAIHSHYLMVPGRFKDYISTPKANNYQSIHTGIIGPLNHRIEIQIRTKDMHQVAELGVAAHWEYKRGTRNHDGRQYAWLRSLLEILEHASGPEEFMEHTKLEMFQDQVFCFTPKGELICLPKGATPIDFAYAIHSEVGDHTVGARVNGKQVPLRTILHNGDQVEISTAKNQVPSPTWERFAITGKARARIRKFIRSQQLEQFAELGRALLQKNCTKEGVGFSEKVFTQALSKFPYGNLMELFAAIGEGLHSPQEVLTIVYPDHFRREHNKLLNEEEIAQKKAQKTKDNQNKKNQHMSIQGLIPGMAIHFAGCCHPLPGDKIVGMITTGKGITIHTHDCETMLSHNDPDRHIDLNWNDERDETKLHVGRLKVTFVNKPGSLAALTTRISKQGGNIMNLKILNRTTDFWDIFVDIEVRDTNHLETIMAAIRTINTMHVERI